MPRLSPIYGAIVFDIATRVPRTDRARADIDVFKRLRLPPSAPAASPPAAPTVSEARATMRTAADALRDAFQNLTHRLQHVRVGEWVGTAGRAASVQGGVGSFGAYSTLAASREVNEQTSTVRISAAALGLDLSSPESSSRISSTGTLGLDVSSPERASTLDSSLALGLDVTSPEQASQLQSSAALGLDVSSAEARSTLASTAEANTAPTSYGVVQATFTKGGTAQTSRGNIAGVYKGTGAAANATSLKLQITSSNVTMGAVPATVSVRVLDQNNTNLGTYVGALATGQSLSLGADIGLSISLTAGSILKNASTKFRVDKNAPTDVDPSASFNNTDVNLRPRFESGAQVTAGSFTVNGTTVNVLANDTINTVLARINSTVAGVSASFSNDKVTFQTTANSEDNIVLAGDTSGFLAALKLTGATTLQGNVRDDQQVLAKTSQFGAVTSGSFTINGVAIALDRNSDTLQSLITRINSASAGVTASYDSGTDRLNLTTLANTEDDVVVASDTTGFLSAANLRTGNTVRGNIRDDQQVLAKTSQFGGVASGSFAINGVAIAVDRNTDTLQSLITQINSAGAGVTASYDSGTDRLKLATLANTEDDIALADDTTGFLAAANLRTGNTVRGNIRDDQQVLAKTAQFGAVTSGSFTVNGGTIAVDRNADTLQSLITKINNAGAAVTASYDAETDRISLVTNSNTEDDIVLANDVTGFLAAAKLSGANTARGNLRDDRQALAKTAQFSAVASGSLAVNGVAIAVDRNADTFESIVTRINSANAGVTASHDSATDKLVFTPNTPGATLALENDTSGFLAAAKVATGASGTRVNADAAFNATGANAPLLEDGRSVVAGSFQVNGVTIQVAADDTLKGVLAKITASAAGVSAAFDAATERVSLTAKSPGPSAITLGADTSGFLAAVKLDGTAASTTGGSTLDSALASNAVFAGVSGGTITVNGQSLAVNPAVDTLSGVVASINGLRGVSATLDSASGRIRLKADDGGDLEINDTSGLLGALGIAGGKIEGTPSTLKYVETDTGRLALDDPAAVSQNIASAITRVNDALDLLGRARNASPLFKYDTVDALRAAVASVSGAVEKGLVLTDSSGTPQLNVNRSQLTSGLSADPHALDEFLSGVQNLPSALDSLLETYDETTAAMPLIPDRATLTAANDGGKILLGEKSKAELVQAQAERQLLLLDSALLRPALPESVTRSFAVKTEGNPPAVSGHASFAEKLKHAYGLPAERSVTPRVEPPETPWLKGLEPLDLVAAFRAREVYERVSEGAASQAASRQGLSLSPPRWPALSQEEEFSAINYLLG